MPRGLSYIQKHIRRTMAADALFVAKGARKAADPLQKMALDAVIDAQIMLYLMYYEADPAVRRHFLAAMWLTGLEQKEVGLE